MPNWIAKIAGYFIKNKLNLEDVKMNDTKPWYQSKTVWSGVIAALIGVYNAIGTAKSLPTIPDWVFSLLGAIGVYSRVNADTKIG